MLKRYVPFIMLMVLILSACNNTTTESTKNDAASTEKVANEPATRTYMSENGPIEVPTHPKRVVDLSSYAGSVLSLNVNLVGVDSWTKKNPNFETKLQGIAEVSDENLEKIIELKPDLILGASTVKNLDKLKKIAPTVTYTYGKVDYLTQHLEIGKVLNKEKEAQAWIDDFKSRAHQAGVDIKAKIGANSTISVIENYEKQIYVFGDHWGRGTEILYQEMKLTMPDKVKQMVAKDGYYDLSQEVLPEYAGDYVIFSKDSAADSSFQQTDTYKNIPAVKNKHLFEVDAKSFYFNDPITLEYQLNFFIQNLLK